MAEFELQPYPGNLSPLEEVRVTVDPNSEQKESILKVNNEMEHFAKSVCTGKLIGCIYTLNVYLAVWIWCHLSCPQSCFHIRGFWTSFEDSVSLYPSWCLQLCCVRHRPVSCTFLGHCEWPNHLLSIMVSLSHYTVQCGLPTGNVPSYLWGHTVPNEVH